MSAPAIIYSLLATAFKASRLPFAMLLASAILIGSTVTSYAGGVPVFDGADVTQSTQTQSDTAATDISKKDTQSTSAGLKCSVRHSDVVNSLNTVADRYQIPRQYMENAARVESRCDPNAQAKGSSAGGLGQFIDDTWDQFGNGSKFDPDANADAMARLTKEDVASLQRKLGRSPTFEEAYLAHQQGMGGAACLLRNPTTLATDCVSSKAIVGNGGNTAMTGGQFSALVEGYYNSGSLSGARAAVANFDASGEMPNSGNFADGSNGTAPINAADFPALEDSATKAASLDDMSNTSTLADGHASDRRSTQQQNFTLLQRRAQAMGRTDSSKDAMDVNSRMRADLIQLMQGGTDTTNVWASLLASENVASVKMQSASADAMNTTGNLPSNSTNDVMPGIPSPQTSPKGCERLFGTTDQNCAPRVADNKANVGSFLANITAATNPVTPAQAAPIPNQPRQ